MASYNTALGMWRASNGGYHPTKEAAEEAEAGAVTLSTPDTLTAADADASFGGVRAPRRSDEQLRAELDQASSLALSQPSLARSTAAQQTEDRYRLQTGDTSGLTGSARTSAADRYLENAATDPLHPQHAYASQLGTVQDLGVSGGVRQLGLTPPSTQPAYTRDPNATEVRHDIAARETQQAEDRFNEEHDANAEENANAWARAWSEYDNLEATDYGLSDEARGYQREGLQQQRELLERMLGFDPNEYATQYADQALARSVALGRSQGGGAAAQQAGVFAALEQAPALQAEGARQASSLENQRLNAAAGVAKSFGELGTLTRGQDEGRAQFESNLGLQIADSVARLSQGQVQLNQQESQMFAEMWMDFARLQSVYAGMSSQEQIAWWQNEAQKRGQDKQLEAVMANIRANGAIDDKDLLDGLFQLGGTLLKGGMGILGA